MGLDSNIRELRNSLGLNQTDFGKKLGVSAQTVSQWESGDAYPRGRSLTAIAALARISVDELVGEDGAGDAATPSISDRVFLDELARTVVEKFRPLTPNLSDDYRRELLAHFNLQTEWAADHYTKKIATETAPPREVQGEQPREAKGAWRSRKRFRPASGQ